MTSDAWPSPTPDGRFGEFGGRFLPESLVPACIELEKAFRSAWGDAAFRDEYADDPARLRGPADAGHRVPAALRASSACGCC